MRIPISRSIVDVIIPIRDTVVILANYGDLISLISTVSHVVGVLDSLVMQVVVVMDDV